MFVILGFQDCFPVKTGFVCWHLASGKLQVGIEIQEMLSSSLFSEFPVTE